MRGWLFDQKLTRGLLPPRLGVNILNSTLIATHTQNAPHHDFPLFVFFLFRRRPAAGGKCGKSAYDKHRQGHSRKPAMQKLELLIAVRLCRLLRNSPPFCFVGGNTWEKEVFIALTCKLRKEKREEGFIAGFFLTASFLPLVGKLLSSSLSLPPFLAVASEDLNPSRLLFPRNWISSVVVRQFAFFRP